MSLELLARNCVGIPAVHEPVYAMANVFSSREYGLSIQVNPDPLHLGLAYFKLHNHYSYLKADKIARISMEYPRYIIHNGRDGKERWILNGKEKKLLMKVLLDSSKIHVVGFNVITVWQAIILFYNSEKLGIEHSLSMECTVANKQQFVQQYQDLYEHLDMIIPIDTLMPNYLQLK